MVARLRICVRTWLPKELAQPLAGSVETWQFRNWRDWPTKPRRCAACACFTRCERGANLGV